MSVSAIGGSSTWPVSTQTPPTPPPMTNTAKLLGLSTDQLTQDLQSGTTLSSLASQDGVSSSSLISSIEQDLQANAPQGAQSPSSSQLQQIATDIASGVKPGGHHHHHHGGGGVNPFDPTQSTDPSVNPFDPTQSTDPSVNPLAAPVTSTAQSNLTSLASALGTDPSTLFSQLTSGQDLSSLLSSGAGAGYGSSLLNAGTGGIAFDQYA